jgi:hypothetical protein
MDKLTNEMINSQLFGFNYSSTSEHLNTTISAEDLLKQIDSARYQLDKYALQMDRQANHIFLSMFGADFSGGDVVIFPRTRKATYDLLSEHFTSAMMKQIKLDQRGYLKEPYIMKGSDLIDYKVSTSTLMPWGKQNA